MLTYLMHGMGGKASLNEVDDVAQRLCESGKYTVSNAKAILAQIREQASSSSKI